MNEKVLRYHSSGVDLGAAIDAKSRIGKLVAATFTDGVVSAFGGFGGLFRFPAGMRTPVLASSADGVGTKIRVAIETGRHATIGIDLVNHCVNDILVLGAKPLFFLDYVAFGKLDPAVAKAVVSGVAAGCAENGCALIGGETAEMPGLYTPPDYDLAGFVVGCVEEDEILGPARVHAGDTLIALESTGLHTNGYSLARRVVADCMGLGTEDRFPGLDASVADVMLSVHRSYLRALQSVIARIHAMAHITGGGIPGNLGRSIPPSLDAVVDLKSWEIPEVFAAIGNAGDIGQDEMFRVFNMGVGMIVVADPEDANAIIQSARVGGVTAWVAGEIRKGSGNVHLA